MHAESLSSHVSCEAVALDTRLLPNGLLKAVRDSACCVCGPSSFVAVGGFDGEQETMDMLVYKVGSGRVGFNWLLRLLRVCMCVCVCLCVYMYVTVNVRGADLF
jgi:hypothetical protein